MAKGLSDTARTILAQAATRADHHLLPLPTSLKAPPVIIRNVISMLIRTGLVAEAPAQPGEPIWEHSEASSPVTLVAIAPALRAIGIGAEVTTPAEPTTSTAQSQPKPGVGGKRANAAQGREKVRSLPSSPTQRTQGPREATSGARGRSGRQSKQEACIALLRLGNGASIAEMMTATGWQSHSVRGFLSGALRKRLNLDVVSQKDESGERRYHIAVLRTHPA